MNPLKRTEGLGEIFRESEPKQPDSGNQGNRGAEGIPGDSGDPNDPDDEGNAGGNRGKHPLPGPPQGSNFPPVPLGITSEPSPTYHFNFKLKLADIPKHG